MEHCIISLLGEDSPGVMHAAATALTELGCNIEEVSQTILQGQYAALIIAAMPETCDRSMVKAGLERSLTAHCAHVTVRPFAPCEGEFRSVPAPADCEPFVVTLHGPDRTGMIAAITGVMAEHKVNIATLKAVFQDEDPDQVVIMFEVALPAVVNREDFRAGLNKVADSLQMRVSLQHRRIFEAVNRI